MRSADESRRQYLLSQTLEQRTWLADHILRASRDKTPRFTTDVCELLGVPTPGQRAMQVGHRAPDYARMEAVAYGPISTGTEDVPDRILRSAQRDFRNGGITALQVGSVMHALADYSLQQRMVSQTVANLAMRPLAFQEHPDPPELAHGLGRFFHGVGDRIDRRAHERGETR